MPAGYADKMEKVINNIPAPVSIIGMRIAEKVMKKQMGLLD